MLLKDGPMNQQAYVRRERLYDPHPLNSLKLHGNELEHTMDNLNYRFLRVCSQKSKLERENVRYNNISISIYVHFILIARFINSTESTMKLG